MAVRVKASLLQSLMIANQISDEEILETAEQIKKNRVDPVEEFYNPYNRPSWGAIPKIVVPHGKGEYADLSKYYKGPNAYFMLGNIEPTSNSCIKVYPNGILDVDRHLAVGTYRVRLDAITEDGVYSYTFQIVIH